MSIALAFLLFLILKTLVDIQIELRCLREILKARKANEDQQELEEEENED